jgi:nucleosome assembly protein 1-like 1
VRKARPTESFFNFFTPPIVFTEEQLESGEIDEEAIEENEEKLELDYQIGEDFKEKVMLSYAINRSSVMCIVHTDTHVTFD